MNRYDHHFRSLPAAVRVNAAQKVVFALGGLMQHRDNGFGPEDDEAIVRQFDLSGMAEFWEIVLSEPMACNDFAHALAVHFMVIEHLPGGTDADRMGSGPAASRAVDAVKVQLLSALRRARIDGESWFIDVPEQRSSTKLDAKAWLGFVPTDTFMAQPDPPPDGVDLSKFKVRPRAAVDWLFAMPKRKHLVPPSLISVLQPIKASPSTTHIATETPVSSGGPGRPTSMQIVEVEMLKRASEDKLEITMLAEAKALVSWLKQAHPGMPRLEHKAIQNKLGPLFRKSRNKS